MARQAPISSSPSSERTPLAEEFLAMVKERAYERSSEPFILASGAESFDYVDLRRGVARGADLRLAAEALIEHLEQHGVEYEAIGGMSMGADPVAHAVALLADKSWFAVRKGEKTHGSKRRIEGVPIEGVRVVVFDDTLSTAGSIADAYEVCVDAGANVVYACALLDRGDAATVAFQQRNVPFSTILTYRDLGIDPVVAPRGDH